MPGALVPATQMVPAEGVLVGLAEVVGGVGVMVVTTTVVRVTVAL